MHGFLLILASASPRRLRLLREAGFDPSVRVPDVDESLHPGEAAGPMVRRLAEAKARSVALADSSPAAVILAADTAVVVDETILGKPADPAEAMRMLDLLRGRTHDVLTGTFLLRADDGRSISTIERTQVRFRCYDDETIRSYVAGGEPLDKAGAYGIQGAGGELVEAVDGSWSNVVGLAVERLDAWLQALDIDPEPLRQPPG